MFLKSSEFAWNYDIIISNLFYNICQSNENKYAILCLYENLYLSVELQRKYF